METELMQNFSTELQEQTQSIAEGLNSTAGQLFSLAWSVLLIIAMWKIFTKAREGGWKSIIPVLNTYTLYKISWGKKWFWIQFVLKLFIYPIAFVAIFGVVAAFVKETTDGLGMSLGLMLVWGICAMIVAIIRLILNFKEAKAFGHGFGFGLGLTFLNPIFSIILGFNEDPYIGPDGKGRPAIPGYDPNYLDDPLQR